MAPKDEFEKSAAEVAALKAKRKFRKFAFRGVDLEQLLDYDVEQLKEILHSRARRKLQRGMRRKPYQLLKKLRDVKKATPPGEKPAPVKTHLRNMLIVPEMIGSQIGVHNGKQFGLVEIRPEMTGHYLGEFAITYKPTKHGKAGMGDSSFTRFIPVS